MIPATTRFILAFVWLVAMMAPLRADPAPLLQIMQEELQRSLKGIKQFGDTPAWYLSYTVSDIQSLAVDAEGGDLRSSGAQHRRFLDIDLRIGARKGEVRRGHQFGSRPTAFPIDDDAQAIRRALWQATDTQYRAAVREQKVADANQAVEADARKTATFSIEPARHFVGPAQVSLPSQALVEERLRTVSSVFRKYPQILTSRVFWRSELVTRYHVTSEGTQIQVSEGRHVLGVLGTTRADDGMNLVQFATVEATGADGLPTEEAAAKAAQKVASDLMKLRVAPVMDAYAGPAILSGPATAVFFHENLGHRVEGRRQDDETQGHTFTNQLGRAILPSFISVYDDPTRQRFGNASLNGYYQYDDEGVPAQRVTIVDHGVLKGYLLSRTLVSGFANSNGHGRKAPGFGVAARQGNLFVEATKTVPQATLRKMLIEECRRQGKPFGLYFEEVYGGSTYVEGGMPQIYRVHPLVVYRVFVDGRPDELVRGVEIIGTPLSAFMNIKACGDKAAIFNGICGAESGPVPVAGIAPSILTTQIETQKETWTPQRPPQLPAPGGNDGK